MMAASASAYAFSLWRKEAQVGGACLSGRIFFVPYLVTLTSFMSVYVGIVPVVNKGGSVLGLAQ